MRKIIREYWIPIIFAILYGVLLMMPFIWFRIQLGSEFKGVYPWITDNEYFYVARIQEVIDGHSLISNAYFAEHKSGLPQQLFLAEYLLAQPLKLFGLSAYAGRILWSGILGIVLFGLTYFLFYLVTRWKTAALAVSVLLLYGFLLKTMARPVSPQFNFVFWLLEFIFFWKMSADNSKRWLVLAGLNLGLLFYIYPYYWTYFVIFAGLLSIAYLATKQKILALNIIKMLFVAGAVSIPYWYSFLQAMRLPEYTESLVRIGMIFSHVPSGVKVIAVSVIGLLTLYLAVRRLSSQVIFLSAALIASVIAVNQHVITGQNFQFSNHYTLTALFVAILAILYSCAKFVRKPWINALSILALALAIVGSFNFLKTSTVSAGDPSSQRYGALFQWLNENTPKDSVVYADADLSEAIPTFTHNNIYYAPSSVLFFASDREILERFLIANYAETIDRDFVMRNVNPVYGAGFQTRYAHIVQENKLRTLLRLPLKPAVYVPEEAIQHVLAEARKIQSQPFTQVLKKYQVDYMITEKSTGEFEIIPVP